MREKPFAPYERSIHILVIPASEPESISYLDAESSSA
jgi:hypothetical protein